MKITITQTRQVQQYEPRRIEVQIDTSEENLEGDWEEFVSVVVESIDRILWPENYEINDDIDTDGQKKNGNESPTNSEEEYEDEDQWGDEETSKNENDDPIPF